MRTDRFHRSRTAGLPMLALALVVLVAASPAGGDTRRVEELVERAERASRRGNREKAARLFAEADEAAGGRSLYAVAGICQENLALGRWQDSIAGAERWIELADDPAARAGGQQCLGLALVVRAMDEQQRFLREADESSGRSDRSPTSMKDLLLPAAEALRLSAGGVRPEARPYTLLRLANVLAIAGEHEEALEVLDEYADAGGDEPMAGDLRCWSKWMLDAGTDDDEAAAEVTPPRLVHSVRLTEHDRIFDAVGSQILSAVIDEQGGVDCAVILLGLESSRDRATLESFKAWRFEPALRDGEPVQSLYHLTVRFAGTVYSDAPWPR